MYGIIKAPTKNDRDWFTFLCCERGGGGGGGSQYPYTSSTTDLCTPVWQRFVYSFISFQKYTYILNF